MLQALTYMNIYLSDLIHHLFSASFKSLLPDLQSILTGIETHVCLEGRKNKSVKLKKKKKRQYSIFLKTFETIFKYEVQKG